MARECQRAMIASPSPLKSARISQPLPAISALLLYAFEKQSEIRQSDLFVVVRIAAAKQRRYAGNTAVRRM